MRIHHLNCISTCPIGGALMDGQTLGLRGRLTCHCLLLETDSGLVLVDTGLGLLDVSMARRRLSRFFLFLVRPEFRAEMTAYRQIQRLGFRPEDVRHIVLTHLDFDHAGGLDDFPGAEVHLLADERDAAVARRTLLDRMRYRPAQWSTQPNWIAYPSDGGERWFGFEGARPVGGLKDEVLFVPLIGHTLGHSGVAIRSDGRWLLLAGDAYFYHREMDLVRPTCTPGLRAYQLMMEKDRGARLENQRRLRALRREHGHEVTLVCSHDVVEFERLTGRSHAVPAGAREKGASEPPLWAPAAARAQRI